MREEGRTASVAANDFQRPYVVSWNLTYRCNLACEHCYLDAGGRPLVTAESFADRSELSTEQCLRVVRSGGLVMLDNVLWSGRVVDPGDDDENTRIMRAINEKIAADERVDHVLVPIGDGLTLARIR